MRLNEIPYLTWAVWAVLSAATVFAFFTSHWSNVFLIITALFLTIAPALFSARFKVRLPVSFLAAISLFVFATLFLGEVFAFYDRFWWWDVILHGMSALGFGLIGFIFIFYLFAGDKYAAPPWTLAFIAFCFAVTIGAVWEIFEFAMDEAFGLNMQKSGLVDTMWDLIVDCVGAFIGAACGFFWMKGQQMGPMGMIEEFIRLNRRGFERFREERRARLQRRLDVRGR